MKSLQFGRNLMLGAVLMFVFTSLASAQATRTWVSGVGDDANPCSRTAPCKTFAGAISKTAANGEINCLDAGGFGGVTITKSITIDCHGTFGSILSAGTSAGIIVNVAATDVVRIHALSINGVGTGLNGIRVIGVSGALHLDAVEMQGFTTQCLDIALTGAVSAKITVERSTFRKCGATANSAGINAGNGARVTIRNSFIGDVVLGVAQGTTVSPAGGTTVLMTDSTVAAASSAAFRSITGGFIGASGNTLSNNVTVFVQNGGQIATGGDNPGFGNGPTGATTGTVGKI